MNWIVNIAIYQCAWFICVLGGDSLAWTVLILLALHLYLTPCLKADLQLIIALFAIGLLLDGSLKAVGLFSFNSTQFPIPFWLMAIWPVLATLPHHSLSWLKKRPLLSALFGAIGGPLAYWAGVRLGAASFNWSLPESLLALALVWAILWPLVMALSCSLLPPLEKSTGGKLV